MVNPRAARALLFALVFVIAFAVYLITLAPSVALNDSGALTLAAWSLGNAHPPGMPLYVMLTHLFLQIPAGSVIWRANVASAFFAALACGFVSLTVFEMLSLSSRARARDLGNGRRESRLRVTHTPDPSLSLGMTSAAAGLLLAFGKTLWAYATVAEVYAMNAALIGLMLWLAVWWRAERKASTLYALALVGGLALGVHYVTVVFALLGVAVLVFRPSWRQTLIAMAIAVATLAAVYAYLPIAASRDPVLNWGDPDSLDRFIGHVTGRQFRVFVGEAGAAQHERTKRYLMTEFGSVAGLVFLIAGVGLFQLLRRDRSLFVALAIMSGASLAWLAFYDIIYDADAYLIPVHIALAITFAIGAAWIARGRKLLAVLCLIAPAIALATNWKWRDRSDFRIAGDFAHNALRGMRGDALLVTDSWQLYSPLLYLLEVERQRPDVKAVLQLMLFWPWYLDAMERRYPEIAAPVKATIAEFRPQSIRYERDLAWRRAGGDARLLSSFDAVVFGLIDSQLDRGGRVYVTPGMLLSRDAVYAQFLPRLMAMYDAVPHGMLVEIVRPGTNREPETIPIDLRGLENARSRFDPDDAVIRDILPAYGKAFHLRGRALANMGRFEESLAAYRQAVTLISNDAALQSEMRRVEAMAE